MVVDDSRQVGVIDIEITPKLVRLCARYLSTQTGIGEDDVNLLLLAEGCLRASLTASQFESGLDFQTYRYEDIQLLGLMP